MTALTHLFHVLCFVLLSSQMLLANGTITGRVTETTDPNMGVSFANVVIDGTSQGTTTDIDGYFTLSAVEGTYQVTASFIGYAPLTKTVTVKEGEESEVLFSIGESQDQLEVVNLVGRQNRKAQGAILMEQKEAQEIVQKIGAQEMAQKGVSDVAEGVTKVVGISKSSTAKQIFVRGMGDRYNAAFMNGLPVPSTSPDLKMMPLDIFPTSVVEQLSIMKAYSPRYYGDFGGALVDILTVQYPEESFAKVKLGLSANTLAAGNTNFRLKNNTLLSRLGFETQGITEDMRSQQYRFDPSQATDFPFDPTHNAQNRTALANTNFGFTLGDKRILNETKGSYLGFVLHLSNKNSSTVRNGFFKNYRAEGSARRSMDYEKFSYETNTTGLAAFTLGLNKNHKLGFTSLLINTTDENFQVTQGYTEDYDNILNTRNTMFQNVVTVNQLTGSHELAGSNALTWGLGMNTATNREPNRINTVYQSSDDGRTYRIFNINDNENHRFWHKMTDIEFAGFANYMLALSTDEDGKATQKLNLGVNAKTKQRTFEFHQFNYTYNLSPSIPTVFPDMDILDPDRYLTFGNLQNNLFQIRKLISPEYRYEVDESNMAGYLDYSTELSSLLSLNAGVRLEQSTIAIRYRTAQDILSRPFRTSTIDTLNLLPSIGLRYTLSENENLRFAASRTVTRPRYKELAPFLYQEFFGGNEYIGNPNLTISSNTNVDLKYENFFAPGQRFAASIFGKHIQNPIEYILQGGTTLTPTNNDRALVAGVEIEGNLQLGDMIENTQSLWKHVELGANITYLYSDIRIQESTSNQQSLQTNNNRPMQGASPLIANADIRYSFGKDLGSSVSAVFNYTSRQLFSAGTQGRGDIYRLSVPMLNLLYTTEIRDGLSVSASVNNVFNPWIRFVQEDTEFVSQQMGATMGRETFRGDLVTDQYKLGMQFSVGATYTF